MTISLWIFIVEALACAAFAPFLEADSAPLAFCVIAVSAISVIFDIYLAKKSKEITFLLLFGLAFRLFLLYFDIYCRDIYVLPFSDQDPIRFARQAANLYLTGVDASHGFLYVHCVAFLYRFFGVNQPIAQYVNLLLSMWMIFIAIRILDHLKVDDTAQTVAIMLICLLPNLAIVNILLMRESVVMFLLSLSLLFFLQWATGASVRYLVFGMAAAAGAALFHSGTIAILVGEVLIWAIYDRESGKFAIRSSTFWILILGIIAFVILYPRLGDSLFRKFRGVEDTSDVINIAARQSRGGSAYEAGFRIANPTLNLIVNTPIRMLYFIASPMPWTWRGVQDLIAFVFSALFYIVVYCKIFTILKRHSQNAYRNYLLMMLVFMLSSALVFAWGVSNSGTAMRHRDKFVIIYIITYALCEASDLRTKQGIDECEEEESSD